MSALTISGCDCTKTKGDIEMIVTENIRNANKGNYDQVWAIVRSLKNPGRSLVHVPELSPSLQLFWTYRRWVQNQTFNKDLFEQVYKPRFLAEMANSPDAQTKLDELVALDKAGKRIALVCFCADVNLCHRSLIAELLTERGVNVTMR